MSQKSGISALQKPGISGISEFQHSGIAVTSCDVMFPHYADANAREAALQRISVALDGIPTGMNSLFLSLKSRTVLWTVVATCTYL